MSRRSIRLPISSCGAGLLAFVALVTPCLAEPTAAEKAMSESLFRLARQLMTDGKVAEACDRFAESQRLDPKLGTLINLGLCNEQQGKTASAWGVFIDAAAQAKRTGQADREEFARTRAAALEPRLSRVVITGTRAVGVKLTVDGQPLSLSAMDAPLPMDPGDHTFAAEAPGKKRWESRIIVPNGPATTTVQIPALQDVPPDPPPAMAPLILAPAAPPPAVSPAPNGKRIAGIVIGSLGLAGLTAGGILGAMTFKREAEARKLCPDTACPTQAGLDLHDSASSLAAGSTTAFIVGGAAVAGGLVLILLSRDIPAAHSAWVAPAPGGLVVGGAF